MRLMVLLRQTPNLVQLMNVIRSGIQIDEQEYRHPSYSKLDMPSHANC